MIYFSNEKFPNHKYDFVVIGSGPCGLAFSEHLAEFNKNISILIVESGGLDFNENIQNLHLGSFLNPLINEDFKNNRARRFGGTSAMWGGESAQLIEDDFEEKEYFDTSGWPIKYSDIEPFYKFAAKYLNLISFFQPTNSAESLLPVDNNLIVQKEWHYSTPVTRLGDSKFELLKIHERINLLLESTVIGVDTDKNKIVSANLFRDGKVEKVTASHFIVAGGGIENVRCLLNWKLKNSKLTYNVDNIGRYFAVHPYFQLNDEQIILLFGQNFNSELYEINEGKRSKIHFTLPQSVRDYNQWENIAILLWNKNNTKMHEQLPLDLLKTYGKFSSYTFNIMCDMRLMNSSTISLNDKKDLTGMFGVNVKMEVHPKTPESWAQGIYHFAQVFNDLGLGRTKLGKSNRFTVEHLYANGTWGAHHHMCATRMSEDSKRGAVDRNCRVFGTDNLYVLGASTFSTASVVNPTFSAVALSVRLAKHLA